MPDVRSTERGLGWETQLVEFCAACEIDGGARAVVLLHLVERLSAPRIRQVLAARQQVVLKVSDIQRVLGICLRKLAALPEFRAASRSWARDVIYCAEDRRVEDCRPEGVRGVTPDTTYSRFQGARIVSGDDRRLRPDAALTCRLWAEQQRPVQVPAHN